MFRLRTRERYSQEDLERIYSYQHDHSLFPDHLLRIEATLGLTKELIEGFENPTAADLSCGDCTVPDAFPWKRLYLGDFLESSRTQFVGPIEETIHQLPHDVDVFFLLETLEHLDDPDGVLRMIREKTDMLVLSTPWMQWRDENIEHYHCWDSEAVEVMLRTAGFLPELYRITAPNVGYIFQIWGCL